MGVLYSDNFDRGNETPLDHATWGQSGTGDFNLTTNQVAETGTGSDHEAYYTAASALGDQYVQAKITTMGDSEQGVGVCARHIGSSTRTFIRAMAEKGAAGPVTVRSYSSGSGSLIGTRTPACADGDVLRMEVTGTSPNIVIKIFVNGVQAGADFTGVTGPNTGKPGLAYSSTQASNADDWEAGDFTTAGQQLRPDADTDADSWTTTPLWSKIDEASAGGDVITATAS